jgi:hypothetical protein
MGEGNEVGKRYDARGGWRKRLSSPGYLVITRGSHLTNRLLEASGQKGGNRRMSGRENLVFVSS